MSFLATAGLGVVAIIGLWFSLPKGSAGERPNVKQELSVLMRPQVLSALLTTVLGAGAMFTLYTYISPGSAYHYQRLSAVCHRDAGADRRGLFAGQLSWR
ncbi:MFS transporter [Klebsiella grimontii]|nr:MFS transporter [Klebsiella grimontii]